MANMLNTQLLAPLVWLLPFAVLHDQPTLLL
jgi:hypothetical protein